MYYRITYTLIFCIYTVLFLLQKCRECEIFSLPHHIDKRSNVRGGVFTLEIEVAQKQEAASRRKHLLMGTCLVFFLIILLVLGALLVYTQDRGVFFPQISIHGITLSGLTLEEGEKQLKNQLNLDLAREITFQIPEEEHTLKLQLKALGFTYDLKEALARAWNIGREGNLLSKALSRLESRRGYEIPLKLTWDDLSLRNTLELSFQPYNIAPKDATFEITEDNKMHILPEQVGRECDLEALIQEIKELTLNSELLKGDSLPTLTVPLKSNLQPKITAAQLEALKITGSLAKYTTYFDSSLLNRSENIRLAALALNKKILAPDDVFSFNQSVGERTAEAGYKEAMIIEGNTFTPGLGGGICQVSSTLYNAITLAHLEVTERHQHSLPISYVPPGQDATVSFPVLDLKFKNTSGGYLLIRSLVQGNSITFELYGKSKTTR